MEEAFWKHFSILESFNCLAMACFIVMQEVTTHAWRGGTRLALKQLEDSNKVSKLALDTSQHPGCVCHN